MVYWINQGSCGNIVSVVIRLWAGQHFFLVQNIQIGLGGPSSLLFSGYWVSFLGVKQLGCEVKHLLRRLTLLPYYAVMALVSAEFV
jgi:hypothetical protein